MELREIAAVVEAQERITNADLVALIDEIEAEHRPANKKDAGVTDADLHAMLDELLGEPGVTNTDLIAAIDEIEADHKPAIDVVRDIYDRYGLKMPDLADLDAGDEDLGRAVVKATEKDGVIRPWD